MKVLVTGASGSIGQDVCEALLKRGDQVVGLSRSPESARQKNPRMEWFDWQAERERPPAEAFAGVEAVVNLIGAPINQRWTDDSKRRILESRETATKNLVDAMLALEAKPGVLVSQSATGYYGDRGDEVLVESSRPGDSFDAGVCVAWEAAARAVEGSGIRLAILRTGPVISKDSGLLAELLLPFKLGVGGPVAGGHNYMAWISLDDELGMLLWLLGSEAASGVYNGCSPQPVTNRTFSKALGKALGRPAIMPVPKLAVVARFGKEMAESVALGSQNALPERALAEGYEFIHPDIDSALAAELK